MKHAFHKGFDYILGTLGSLCLLYFLYLSIVYGFFVISFSWTFLVMGFLLVIFAYYELHHKQHLLYRFPKVLQRIVVIIMAFFLLLFFSVESYILYQGSHTSSHASTTALVLGAQLNGKQISRLLRYRLEAALAFSKEYPDATILVSGGKGPGESISEASAMKAYLIEHGVAEHRILVEDQSLNTQQNIAYSLKVLEENNQDKDLTIITNSFHMARARFITSKVDSFTGTCTSYPAKTDFDLAPVFYFREFIAFIKDFLIS